MVDRKKLHRSSLLRQATLAAAVILIGACGADSFSEQIPGASLEAPEAAGAASKAMPRDLRAAYIAAMQRGASPAYDGVAQAKGLVRMENPAQRFVATADRDGVVVTSDEEPWSFSMRTTGVGCEGAMAAVPETEPEAEGNRGRYLRESMEEWYLNGPLGLEQGFVLSGAPACAGPKVIAMQIEGGLRAELDDVDADGRGESLRLVDADGRAALAYTDLFVTDAEGKALPAWLTVDAGEIAIHVDDAGAAYPLAIDPLIVNEQQKLVASDGAANDFFGFSVALSGDTAIVGARNNDSGGFSNRGAAYVFAQSGGVWTLQQKLVASDGVSNDLFGTSVALSGDTAIVGALFDDIGATNTGSVYVFVRSGGVWTEQQKLFASDGTFNDIFGASVALVGDTAVVGAPADVTGSAYVFVRSGASWTQQQKLVASDGVSGDNFGVSVALSGETALVGANVDAFGSVGSVGSAYVFVRSGAAWTEQQKLFPSNVQQTSGFGGSVALSGDTALVGQAQTASVFVRSGSVWTEQQELVSSDIFSTDGFGGSVALSGDTALVTAPGDNFPGGILSQGSAYVFVRSGTVWTERQKLVASDGAQNDLLGTAVALSGSTALVGAYNDDVGANAEQGSVYVFGVMQGQGSPCSSAAECAGGICTDGVCCNTACNAGTCDACSVAAGAPSNGTCALLTGIACDDGNACTTVDACQAGICTGASPVVCSASDQCHVTGTCNTVTGTCSNPNAANGAACTDGNACTTVDTCQAGSCTGASPVVCAASDQCHSAGTCDTVTGQCSNPAASNGTACNDGNACTTVDTCQAGVCVGTSPVVCAASDQCHSAGTCNTATGTCSNPAASNGTACTDGNACTTVDTCQAGTCTGASPVVCSASDQCHSAGTCDTATGQCSNPAASNGTVCSDGNACTTVDTCQAGVCTGASPVVCAASDQCHVAGTCNTATGTCSNPAVSNGTACTDGNACTTVDTCQAGTCTGASPVVCAASDQCHVAGTCNTATGTCSNPNATNGVSCSDGNACTTVDTCQAGTCTGASPVVCSASDQCHVAGTCNTATGTCSNPTAVNGVACSDGNACTTVDTCQAGTCTGASPVVCAASDQCHSAGTCDTVTGLCSNPAVSNGTACNDGNACTTVDTCQAGVCVGTSPVVCAASDQCHVAGTCNTATGICSNPNAANGAACSDGNACTTVDTCQAGTCTAGSPVLCAAADQCHGVGTCDPGTGACSNPSANGTPCDDGNACTTVDTCQAGVCTGASPVVCAASDQCHVAGTCDTVTGTCSNPNAANGSACSDGNACTTVDTCQAGVCMGASPVVCAASDQCHVAGTCNTATGTCSNPNATNGAACSDGNACTQTDTCQAGACTGANPVVCGAPDQCHTAGTCDTATGTCSNPAVANGTACSDSNACTLGDTCQAGVCTSNPVICPASDACHLQGTCDPVMGCSNPVAPNGTPCNDGSACTAADACEFGVCTRIDPLDGTCDGVTCKSIQSPALASTLAKDTQIANDVSDPTKANTNYGGTDIITAGYIGIGYNRILVGFDLAAAGVPAIATLTSATFTFHMVQSLGKNPVDIHACTGLWNESTVTWNTMALAPNGGLGALQATIPTVGVANHTNISVPLDAAVVQGWLAPGANYGLMLDHPLGGRTQIGSRAAVSLSRRPKLQVCYDEPLCSDGLQNQGEAGVDCGGPCLPCAPAPRVLGGSDQETAELPAEAPKAEASSGCSYGGTPSRSGEALWLGLGLLLVARRPRRLAA